MTRRPLVVRLALLVSLLGVAWAVSACASTIIVDECAESETLCDSGCVDLSSDPDHCGGCDTVCSEGLCADGQCRLERCMPPAVVCGGECVDTSTDPTNCGGCGLTCPIACVGSQCVDSCPGGTTDCSGACVDTTTDPNNCGGCGLACAPDQFCAGSRCFDGGCPPDLTNCFGFCVDLQFDPNNCGGCGIVCSATETCEFFECVGTTVCDDNICGICDYVFLPDNDFIHTTGTTAFAQNNHSPFCADGGSPEVLHVYTPGVEGSYTIDTIGSSYDTILEVLDSQCQPIACSDDVSGVDAVLQMQLSANETYFIVVDGFGTGDYALNLEAGSPCPPGMQLCADGKCVDTDFDNDNCGFCGNVCPDSTSCNFGNCESQCFGPCGYCDSPIFLPSSVPQSFQGATGAVVPQLFSSCGDSSGPEAMHSFVAPFSGSYVFSTANSSFDTVLYLLDQNSCGELACNDNFGMGGTSRITTTLAQGQEVYAVVDGNFGQGGFYQLSITGTPQPACPTSALASTVPQTVSGNTQGAGNFYTPTCTFSQAPEHTFSFTAPSTKTYVFDTFGSSYDTALYVLSGTCVGQQLACSDDENATLQSMVSVPLTAGQTVTIVVDGFDVDSGSYVLHIQ